MFKMKNLIVLLLLLALIGCGDDGASSETTGSNPTTPTNPIDNTEVGEIESSGFWVNIRTNNQFPVYINSEDGFGSPCLIESSSSNGQVLNCYVDVMEGDLFVYDLEMQYNLPPDMCEHLRTSTSWFWNRSVGTGPSNVSLSVDSTGDLPRVTDCQAMRDNTGTMVSCSTHPELLNTSKVEGPDCVYDEAPNGENCCFGEYTLTVTTTTADGTNSISEQKDWGGTAQSCIGGASKQGWDAFIDGFPANLIIPVPEADDSSGGGEISNTIGLNQSFIYSSNSGSANSRFSLISNFYETTGSPHSHNGFYSSRVSNQPYAFDPIDDLDGSLITSGRDAFEFTCLDGAFEEKHRIRVYIREWNTFSEFTLYQTSSGSNYNPDVVGVPGVDCPYSSVFGNNCNDFDDFKDLLIDAGGSYNTSPGINATTRASYFPNIEY